MTGPVARDISRLRDLIEQTHSDPEATYFKYSEARDDLKALRQSWEVIKALAATLERADSDRVLGFCRTWAGAIDMFGEGC